MISYLKILASRFLMLIFSFFPIKENKIVFTSFRGRQFSDSPMCIYEQMKNKAPNMDFVWIIDSQYKNGSVRCVKKKTIKELYELATAKVWVDNCRKRLGIRKRKNQIYIQTWHGNIVGKKVEKDTNLSPNYIRMAKHDSTMIDYFLSGSTWASKLYRNSFWYDGKIWEDGLPRSDIFYQDTGAVNDAVRSFYNLDRECKLILYAPTFRNNQKLDCFILDFKRILDVVKAKYGGEWKMLVRFHPNFTDFQSIISFDSDILDGLAYHDINHLIVSSEILISDYSSCMFDAMEAKKIVMVFATDVKEYEKERGHYFSLEELPFPVCQNNDQLVSSILEFDQIKYDMAVKNFSNQCGILNNAYSSEIVAEKIIKIMNYSE